MLLLTCLACIAIGFFLPMAPIVRDYIGSAVFAGSLASAGAIAGMYVADAILAWIEPREPNPGLRESKRILRKNATAWLTNRRGPQHACAEAPDAF